ncbi:hypothetical protein CEXT_611911 [Caerostris extrusa]|uniref:Uncharacterized protein n=1 Tax=Caerostris extrusa TaxID=172846 RepID=A0AAV4MLU1_CAEEX|nr:hypothetical protein CEXT_611911 [Caerostris extrusa]
MARYSSRKTIHKMTFVWPFNNFHKLSLKALNEDLIPITLSQCPRRRLHWHTHVRLDASLHKNFNSIKVIDFLLADRRIMGSLQMKTHLKITLISTHC